MYTNVRHIYTIVSNIINIWAISQKKWSELIMIISVDVSFTPDSRTRIRSVRLTSGWIVVRIRGGKVLLIFQVVFVLTFILHSYNGCSTSNTTASLFEQVTSWLNWPVNCRFKTKSCSFFILRLIEDSSSIRYTIRQYLRCWLQKAAGLK